MLRNRNEVENTYKYEAFKSTCYDWTSKDDVEIYKKHIILEKEELYMKKENKEILKKKHENEQSTV